MQSFSRYLGTAAALLFASTVLVAQSSDAVRVWQGTLSLPSYAEGAPDPNPPFDVFGAPGRPNYPYTIRDQLTDRRAVRAWRALFLENEYLKCSVLPDLGGHLYSCTDKVNGEEMFYANPSIKLSNIAYRGSWAAFGIEFNFPVSHNWVTTSPVDFSWARNTDGSGSVWVGNIDRVYGMQWRVRLTLRPGRSVLEQQTTLYNRSDVRRRFYWWTNAGVRVWDDSRILYPQKWTASHGFTLIDTWPVDQQGTDNTVLKNQVYGPVSRFSHGSREPFMAVYHPRTDAGIVHYSGPTDAPAKKFWSWGVDADALDWRRALSDDSSAYVEIQAGLFRDQETYGFMDPHERVAFTEYWLPLRGTGGLTRATPDAALRMERVQGATDATIDVALNVTQRIERARIELRDGSRVLQSEMLALGPAVTLRRQWRVPLDAPPLTLTIRDSTRTLVGHTEGQFDLAPDSSVKPGPQAPRAFAPAAQRSAAEWYDYGEEREVNGDYLGALGAYRSGLAKEPQLVMLLRATGRLAVTLRHYALADSVLSRANVQTPSDHEGAYYYGLARLAHGDTLRGRTLLEFAQQYGRVRPAASYALAAIDAQHGDYAMAYGRVRAALAAAPAAERLRTAAAILARAAHMPDARDLLDSALAADPTSTMLRAEQARGSADADLDRHLASDPERILTVATEYMRLGLYADALDVLSRRYPADGLETEKGMPHPDRYPLIAYYRGYVKERLGRSGAEDWAAAARMPATYVFPSRDEDVWVLRTVVRHNDRDALAHYLLGDLQMAAGDVNGAIGRWQVARALQPALPALHRSLGYALLLEGRTQEARAVFEDGIRFDRGNAGVYFGFDSTLALQSAPAAERARVFEAFPDQVGMPTAMVYRLTSLLAQAGRYDDAELQLRRPFFARVEGGTNVRGVWLDVRLARAEALVSAGKCRDALRIATGLSRPVAAYGFTRDGLDALLSKGDRAARVQRLKGQCSPP